MCSGVLFHFSVCAYLARAPAALKILGTPASRPLIYFLYACLKFIRCTNQSIKSIIVEHQYTNLCAKLQFIFNKKKLTVSSLIDFP